jgi:transcriptional regulator with XRE-family HTH domain
LDLDAFGAFLRLARERRGLRVIDLAVEMGWAGTAPVYRYERGGPDAPRPDPDTINQLAHLLGLSYPDRMTLLGLAGHLPDTVPLSRDEEQRLVAALKPTFDRAASPALVFDYRGRILAVSHTLAGLLPDMASGVPDVTLIDLVWNPALGLAGRLIEPDAMRRFQAIRFQAFNALRRHEDWYRALPDRYGHHLGFRDLWFAVEETQAHGDPGGSALPSAHAPVAVTLPGGSNVSFDVSQVAVHGGGGLVAMLVMRPMTEPADLQPCGPGRG